MFILNDDLSIYATRGDIVFFTVTAEYNGVPHVFKAGDVVRIKIYGKKNANELLLQKDFPVARDCEGVDILLSKEDTQIGDIISKPKDYWYEVVVNDDTKPQTIIGYDDDGAKVFKLFPEGKDLEQYIPDAEDIPFVDTELDLLSPRPVQNQAIARAIVSLQAEFETTKEEVTKKSNDTAEGLAVERSRIDNLVAHKVTTTNQALAYIEDITEVTKAKIDGTIESDGAFATIKVNLREANLIYGGTTLDLFVVPSECRPIEVGLVHTEDGLEYRIRYDNANNRYYLSITAQSGVTVAPSGAGSVTMTYPLAYHELLDIRVGADGIKHETAGAAVRAQFQKLSADVKSSFVETGYADGYISACKVFTDEYENIMISDIRRGYDNETGFRIYSCDETGKEFSYVSKVALEEGFEKGYVEHTFGQNSLLKCYVDLTAMEHGSRRTGDGKPFVLKRECFLPTSSNINVETLKNVLFSACNTNPKKILTWVDDDTPENGIATVKTICDTLGVKCTFATITQGWTDELLEMLHRYQKEGFHITSHTESHGRWYKDMPEGKIFTANEMEADLLTSLEKMRLEGFIDCDMLVYPGSAIGRTDVNTMGIVKKWCRCGVVAGGTTWSKYGQGKYKINRTFISKSNGAAYYTNLLDSMTDEGWVVFGTHSGSTTDFDADMMNEILSYALANGWAIMPLNEALKYREKYYHIQEMLGL